MKSFYRKWFAFPYTVACDVSPFPRFGNEEEQLFHVNGLWRARRFAKNWVNKHVYGQARIIEGHKNFS